MPLDDGRVPAQPPRDLEAEFHGYLKNLTTQDAEQLHDAGVRFHDIVTYQMIGAAHVKPVGDGLWEPDPNGRRVFITPVRVEYGQVSRRDIEAPDPYGANRMGQLIDLVAWSPDFPGHWSLRKGEAAVLGSTQFEFRQYEGEPGMLRRDPFDWLRHGATGVVILTKDPQERATIERDVKLAEASRAPVLEEVRAPKLQL